METPMSDYTLYLVLFHVEDAHGAPLGGASAAAVSDNGDWASNTNACGDVIDPGSGIAGVMLSPGDYTVTFTKAGYESRELPVTILAEGPPIRVGLDRAGPSSELLPPIPSRAEVCGLQTSLAGLTYHTTQFGSIPAWFYGALNEDDRAIARAAHLEAGDTHIPIPITAAYREEGTLWPAELREGYDYTQDLDTFRALLTEMICGGLFPDVALGGDGLGMGPGYNDEVGKTYGYGWMMSNMARIFSALQGDGTPAQPDLTPYIIFRPGWDACFYGWDGVETAGMTYTTPLRWRYRGFQPHVSPTALDAQQTRVKQFGEHFRALLPNGYLSIEHTPGTIPCGEGGGDYAPGGLMRTFDTILSEFATVHEDSCWQVVGRMVSPYHRPPDQPAGDDPRPPFYLAPGTERGPYYYVGFEPTDGGAYEWCRGRCSVEEVNTVRAYLRDLGCTYTG
jgi:hypothetical protein